MAWLSLLSQVLCVTLYGCAGGQSNITATVQRKECNASVVCLHTVWYSLSIHLLAPITKAGFFFGGGGSGRILDFFHETDSHWKRHKHIIINISKCEGIFSSSFDIFSYWQVNWTDLWSLFSRTPVPESPQRRRTTAVVYNPHSNRSLDYDDPGTMSDVELSSFQRGGYARTSLPIVRSASLFTGETNWWDCSWFLAEAVCICCPAFPPLPPPPPLFFFPFFFSVLTIHSVYRLK